MEHLPTKGTYCGIADCHGLESLILIQDAEVDFLFLRSASNPQRCSTVFRVELEADEIAKLGALLKDSDFEGALTWLKNSELKTLQVANTEHWSKIPDPQLDPWHTATREEKIQLLRSY